MQVRWHLESEGSVAMEAGASPSAGLASRPNRSSRTLSNNALLHPLRSRATWENAGLHGGERVIADKDEVGGSSPPRPTKRPLTSRNDGRIVLGSAAADVSRVSKEVSSP